MSDEAISRAAKLPLWSGPVEPQPLDGGITNRNFVVRDRGRRFVVRIGGDIEAHGVLRGNELAASRAAALAGVSPEVIYAEPGVLVIAFVEGRTLTPADIRDRANLPALVALVRRCHRDIPRHLRGAGILFWPFHVIRNYGHVLRDSGNGRPALSALLDQAERLERAVGPVELVFGHNDLLAGNIIDDGDRLWLIDWDYAGFNSPLFDLGGLASNSDMPEAMRGALLEAYFEIAANDGLRRRFAAMTAVSLLRETLWSMVSESQSTIDFDYSTYTAENSERFALAFAHWAEQEA